MSQPIGKCIFCGRSGSLTKQHIIPDRLKRLVPRVNTGHVQSGVKFKYSPDRQAVSPQPFLVGKQGHQGNKKWRKVCGKCNGGWIKKIEDDAFEILKPIILGRHAPLSVDDQTHVAKMASTIACMADIDNPETSGISQEERTFLFETKHAPDGWLVFMGVSDASEWETRFRHHGAASIFRGSPTEISPKCNSQITTAALGKCALHVVSGPVTELVNIDGYSTGLSVHPLLPASKPLDTSDLAVLDNAAMDLLSDFLYREVLRRS